MKRLFALIALSLILASLLSACDTSRNAKSEYVELDGIRLTLWSPHAHYENGEIIQVVVTVENITDQTVVIEDTNEAIFDVTYVNNGIEVSWIDQHPELMMNRLELAPGEKIETEISFVPTKIDMYGYAFTGFLGSQTIRRNVTLSVSYGPGPG